MKARRGTIGGGGVQRSPTLFDVPHASVEPASGEPFAAVPVQPDFPGTTPGSAIAISTLTQTAKDVVEGAFVPLWVRGEVTDFKAHRNGHWYFCLRDSSSVMRCVVWSRDQRGIPAAPDEGMQVTALGQLGVYAARGEMQFTIRKLDAEGEGLWRKALELTRQRLDADGLLAPERKRPLPLHPRRIAMVTSASGAALRDVISVLRRRAPGMQLVVVHAAVQGEGAPDELCAALRRVAAWGGAELVIIGRGGGSREDLWAFNDERVARAVAACPVPTISAVGHEVDVTLCDLVADLRAATPSAAAEAAAASRTELAMRLQQHGRRMSRAVEGRLSSASARLIDARETMQSLASATVRSRRLAMESLGGRLHALSPLATMGRGYALAHDGHGRTLASVADFAAGLPFALRLRDGSVGAMTAAVSPDVEAP